MGARTSEIRIGKSWGPQRTRAVWHAVLIVLLAVVMVSASVIVGSSSSSISSVTATPARPTFTDAVQEFVFRASDGTPVTIAIRNDGLGSRNPWHATISPSGSGLMMRRGVAPEEFHVSRDQREFFLTLLEKQGFFQMHSAYGKRIFDCDTLSISVSVGTQRHSVQVRYLMSEPETQREAMNALEGARALQIISHVLQWHDREEAKSQRRYAEIVRGIVRTSQAGPALPGDERM